MKSYSKIYLLVFTMFLAACSKKPDYTVYGPDLVIVHTSQDAIAKAMQDTAYTLAISEDLPSGSKHFPSVHEKETIWSIKRGLNDSVIQRSFIEFDVFPKGHRLIEAISNPDGSTSVFFSSDPPQKDSQATELNTFLRFLNQQFTSQ